MDKNYHTKKQWIKWYGQKEVLLTSTYGDNVNYRDFYHDLFDGSLQKNKTDLSGKGNAMMDVIAYYKNDKSYKHKYIMNEDLAELKYVMPIRPSREESRLCLCSPVTYYGRHKSNAMAHELVAVTLDLDYVGIWHLKNVIKQLGNGVRIPPPTYLVNSGRGLHFYYLLEEPVPCYGYMLKQLTKFKSILQEFIWNETSSMCPDEPDHGAITQAFRMVGSESKLGKDYPVTAYRIRDERWTIGELYAWTCERYTPMKEIDMPQLRDPIEVYRQKHPLTLEEAKKKYPDWEPDAPKGRWTCKVDLYNWWIRQIKEKSIVGGRYYCIMALAAYGSKCGVPFEQIEKDAYSLFDYLESLTNDETNHFKKSDIDDALSFYKNNKAEITYKLTRDYISKKSKINIKKNNRNYRKQINHIAYMNNQRAFKVSQGECTNGGRPSKEEQIKVWRKAHPDGRKIDCIRETGLAKSTVYKWWDA